MSEPAKYAWACFGQWLEIATKLVDGDADRVALTQWAKWFGEGLGPDAAAKRYDCIIEGHEWACDHENDPPVCIHCMEEQP